MSLAACGGRLPSAWMGRRSSIRRQARCSTQRVFHTTGAVVGYFCTYKSLLARSMLFHGVSLLRSTP